MFGDFNNWEDGIEIEQSEFEGIYEKTLYLQPGEYMYK